MNKNYSSKLTRVSNGTLATLGMRVVDTVDESGIEEAVESKQFRNLKVANDDYQSATNPVNVKLLSENIEDLFKARKQNFTDICTCVKGLTVSDDEVVKKAALRIYEELTKFGKNFSRVRKADLTMRYARIIESLQKPEYAELLLTTKLTAKLTAFSAVQRAYEEQYMGRGNRIAGKVAPSSIRKQLENALKKHLEETFFLCEKYETEAWKTLYANLRKRFDEVSIAGITTKQDAQTSTVETSPNGSAL